MRSAPIRILHLICKPQRRGAELFATRLARCLQGEGLENALCSLYQSTNELEDEIPPAIPMFILNRHPGNPGTLAGFNFRLAHRLYGLLRDFQPDIVVAHGGHTLTYAALTKLFCKKTCTIYKNIGTASFWASTAARVSFNKLLLKKIDVVVSVSEYTRLDFLRLYHLPKQRVKFIPNGIDVPEFDGIINQARPNVRQALGVSPSDTVFITVGSLTPEKCHGTLLQLSAELRNSGIEHHLLLIGDGPLRQELQHQANELGIAGFTHFLGLRDDVPSLLAAADLSILPSKTEGMPAVLIEMGLAGLPSVAFDVGGVGEVIEHEVTGLIVPPGDLRMLVRAVSTLCQDQDRRSEMGAAARQRCVERFDMRVIAEQYQELMLGLVGGEPVVA